MYMRLSWKSALSWNSSTSSLAKGGLSCKDSFWYCIFQNKARFSI